MSEEESPIVIDNGSGTIKAGFAGDDAPKSVFPSVVGFPKNVPQTGGVDVSSISIGAEAVANGDALELQFPISGGKVNDWDNLERLWRYTFEIQLRKDPAEHNMLLMESPMNPKGDRENMIKMAFDNFGVQGAYIANSAVLALYASGRTTGIVLNLGDGVTQAVPIYEGFTAPRGPKTLHLGGQGDDSVHYTLPDGQVISVGEARYQVPEALNPEEGQGIHKLVFDSIRGSNIDIQTDLFGNVVLAGGTTMFEGLYERLMHELSNLAPSSTKVKIIAPPERKYSTWIGGSILSSLSTFENMWISAAEYEEVGPSIVHRKCT